MRATLRRGGSRSPGSSMSHRVPRSGSSACQVASSITAVRKRLRQELGGGAHPRDEAHARPRERARCEPPAAAAGPVRRPGGRRRRHRRVVGRHPQHLHRHRGGDARACRRPISDRELGADAREPAERPFQRPLLLDRVLHVRTGTPGGNAGGSASGASTTMTSCVHLDESQDRVIQERHAPVEGGELVRTEPCERPPARTTPVAPSGTSPCQFSHAPPTLPSFASRGIVALARLHVLRTRTAP